MKPIRALAALLLLIGLAQPGRSQAQDRTFVWREVATRSNAVVTARVIKERSVELPDRRVTRWRQLPNGHALVEFPMESDYRLGSVWTLQVEAVHKPDGRVAVGGVIEFLRDYHHRLDQGESYVFFLREGLGYYLNPDQFRGATLVSPSSDPGRAPTEVAFDPQQEHLYTVEPVPGFSNSAGVDAPFRLSPMGPERAVEIEQMYAGILQSLDQTPPTVTYLQTPGAVIRGHADFAVSADDNMGVREVLFGAEPMVPGHGFYEFAAVSRPPYSASWDTTRGPDGPYRVWIAAVDLRGNKGANPPIHVVVDNRPPTLAIVATPSTIWPPDGNPVPVTVAVEVADRIDTAPRVRLTSIVANAPNPLEGVAGASFGEDDRAFTLAVVQGREYQITYEAEDAAGNTVQATTMAAVNRVPVVLASGASAGCQHRLLRGLGLQVPNRGLYPGASGCPCQLLRNGGRRGDGHGSRPVWRDRLLLPGGALPTLRLVGDCVRLRTRPRGSA